MGLNLVQIIGNLGNDPEMRFMPNGDAVTNFRIAASRRYRNAQGDTIEETEWFNVVTYRKLAENCNQYLNKGSMAYVSGRMHTRTWTGEDKAVHYKQEVIAGTVQFLTKGASALESPDAEHIVEEEQEDNSERPAPPKKAAAKTQPKSNTKVVKKAAAKS